MKSITVPAIRACYQSAFLDAVKRYDHESLNAFFSFSDEDARSIVDDKGCSALHIAVKAGRSGAGAGGV